MTDPVTNAPASGCWLHPALEVRASPIEGVGLFSKTDIQAGEPLSILGGRLVSTAELARLIHKTNRAGRYVDTITAGPDLHLVLTPDSDNGKGNHSCDPNAWWTDAYTLVARRRIGTGEEVTNDYATSTDRAEFQMTCACRAPCCRHLISGDDWRRHDLRNRYGERWVPAVLARIRSTSSPTA